MALSQMNREHQQAYLAQLAQAYEAYVKNTKPVDPPTSDDEFSWLRRRVDEVCWKAA